MAIRDKLIFHLTNSFENVLFFFYENQHLSLFFDLNLLSVVRYTDIKLLNTSKFILNIVTDVKLM